jgi:hypothetical protein
LSLSQTSSTPTNTPKVAEPLPKIASTATWLFNKITYSATRLTELEQEFNFLN